MSKQRECSTCHKRIETDNKGRVRSHTRWDWPGWPDVNRARTSQMDEKRCEGAA